MRKDIDLEILEREIMSYVAKQKFVLAVTHAMKAGLDFTEALSFIRKLRTKISVAL